MARKRGTKGKGTRKTKKPVKKTAKKTTRKKRK